MAMLCRTQWPLYRLMFGHQFDDAFYRQQLRLGIATIPSSAVAIKSFSSTNDGNDDGIDGNDTTIQQSSAATAAPPKKINNNGGGASNAIRKFNSPGKDGMHSTSNMECHKCGVRLRKIGIATYSCDKCFTLYSDRVQDCVGSKAPPDLPSPKKIALYLDKYIVGQIEAKATLGIHVYSHYRRVQHNLDLEPDTMSPIYPAKSTQQQQSIDQRTRIDTMYPDYESLSSSKQRAAKSSPIPALKSLASLEYGTRLEKSNILLLGPSGVGKTYMVKMLAQKLNLPIAVCDCTALTQAGYVGDDVETCIQKLVNSADGSAERAARGIVYLDEFDKLSALSPSMHSTYRDVGGQGVQDALLKIVEGSLVTVKPTASRSGGGGRGAAALGGQDSVTIDTTDILFIASGAFSNLYKTIGKRLDRKMIGFGSVDNENDVRITNDDKDQRVVWEKRDKLLAMVEAHDLIEFGMTPELIGRFPIIVPFHSLNEDLLVRVLTEPRNSLLEQYKQQFKNDGIDLQITADALQEIARQAATGKTGARALKSHMEKVLKYAKFETFGTGEYSTVTITRDVVIGKENAYLTRKSDDIRQKKTQQSNAPTAAII